MSYEDIIEAQWKRSMKEATKETVVALGKRGQKCKSPTLAGVKAKKVWRSEAEVVKDEIAVGGMEDYYSILQL